MNLEDALNRTGTMMFGNKRTIKDSKTLLKPNEQILYATIGNTAFHDDMSTVKASLGIKGKTVEILIITSDRIIIGHSLFLNRHYQEILFNEVLDFGSKSSFVGVCVIYIQTSKGILTLDTNKNSADLFMNICNNLKNPNYIFESSVGSGNNSENSKSIYEANTDNIFNFPDFDANGYPILNICDLNIKGIMHEQCGRDPQDVIRKLQVGEQIILEADPKNKYDKNAVKVKTVFGIPFGWLPKGEDLQIDICERLQKKQTVYARVSKIYELSYYPGNLGIVIEIARYNAR